MSYTPYTWQSGDTVTASRLNNIEQGVASAGGGVFKIHGIYDSGTSTISTDKSYNDILSAWNSGQLPILWYEDIYGDPIINVLVIVGFSTEFYSVSFSNGTEYRELIAETATENMHWESSD